MAELARESASHPFRGSGADDEEVEEALRARYAQELDSHPSLEVSSTSHLVPLHLQLTPEEVMLEGKPQRLAVSR